MSFLTSRNNYFSVSDILASQERVPCVFLKNVTHLESLDPSSDSGVLLQGTNLEVPLWMAQSLEKSNVINIELPAVYKSAYRLQPFGMGSTTGTSCRQLVDFSRGRLLKQKCNL